MGHERCDTCGKRPEEWEVTVWPYDPKLYGSGKDMAEMVRSLRPETNEPLIDRRYHLKQAYERGRYTKYICGPLRESTDQEDFTYWMMGERYE